jgi:hypothetical protein
VIGSISKILSSNDVGTTGGHQAGMLIPKDERILGFFPNLDRNERNPRCRILFRDDAGSHLHFNFIYYNNGLIGGTRNEYRLTGMTKWIRGCGLSEGDEIVMMHSDVGYSISPRRKVAVKFTKDGALKIGSCWKIINLQK